MDFLSHILWPIALGKIIKIKNKIKFSLKWAGFWGAFPDLLAFSALTFWSIFTLGEIHPANHALADATAQTYSLFYFTDLLYNIGHSFVIFFIVLLLLWLIKKRFYWAMGGWFLHIFIDMFTHTKLEYATPILWPISSFVIDGFAWWRETGVLTINYIILSILLIYLYHEQIISKLKKIKKIE